jgi:hypothetical protein
MRITALASCGPSMPTTAVSGVMMIFGVMPA